MLARLLRWEVISQAEYTLVDEMAENIKFARAWLPGWAKENGLQTEEADKNELRIFDAQRDVRVKLVQADVFDFCAQKPAPADLLIAHAFLDLLPMPAKSAETAVADEGPGLADGQLRRGNIVRTGHRRGFGCQNRAAVSRKHGYPSRRRGQPVGAASVRTSGAGRG